MAWGWTIVRGSSALFRASLVRALTASAVLAGALTLAGCYGDDGYQLPTRAMKELSPEMLTLLDQKNMPKESPILVRIFKEESELEVWKQDSTARYELLKVYPICRWSGGLGPKVKEGDRQAPEGFYPISPGLMNPNSQYYLAINTGFPNAYDKANGYSGAFLMIHGDCSSRGCYAMTDEQIGEIYSLAREAFLGGQKAFQVQAYPFRMTAAKWRATATIRTWRSGRCSRSATTISKSPIRSRRSTSAKSIMCSMRSRRPARISRWRSRHPAAARSMRPIRTSPSRRWRSRSNDDYQFAQMQNVATAPIETGTDGGMNRVFMSKLENPTYTYDNEGHLHVPPLQPGRLPPQISTKESSYAAANPPSSGGGTVSSFFGGLFNKNSTRVASTDTSSTGSTSATSASAPSAPTHSGFFSSPSAGNSQQANARPIPSRPQRLRRRRKPTSPPRGRETIPILAKERTAGCRHDQA